MSKNLTEVRLLAVPLENDYIHTLYFSSASAQETYFKSKQVDMMENCTYQRKDNIIRYDKPFDEILKCNYVMYRNPAHSDKWFYAFITKLEYKDEGRTDIYIETDVIQTWLFDYTVKPSFVEREHVEDDTIGLHTVPEQVETGEYIINKKNRNASLLAHTLIIATTVDLNRDDLKPVGGGAYNGIYSGIKYYKVSHEQATTIIKKLANAGKAEAIVSIFVCPSIFVESTVPEGKTYAEVDNKMEVEKKPWINTFGIDETNNYKPTDLNGYVPKNNKLFTYPYCYMLMNNASGGSCVYKYELFNNPDDPNLCNFYIYSAITPGFSIRIVPEHYNNVELDSLSALNLGKFPICPWNTDVYTNWLTQNSINIGVSVAGGLLSIAGGVASAVASGGTSSGVSAGLVMGGLSALSGVNAVAGSLGEVYTHSLQPPQQEGNLNAGDVVFASSNLTFYAYQMTIKEEYARIIDGYFNCYGYKVNTVKTPAKNHRANYWYTKTIDVNIDGAIPMEDLRKIKDCYNNGITFWKNSANIGNYSVDNSII